MSKLTMARCTWCGLARRWRIVENQAGLKIGVPVDATDAVREFPYACAHAPFGQCEAPASALDPAAAMMRRAVGA